MTYRRLWKCKACRKPFSVLVGTIFERTQVPLSKWLMALYLMSASKNGVAANELRRPSMSPSRPCGSCSTGLREAMRASSFPTMPGTSWPTRPISAASRPHEQEGPRRLGRVATHPIAGPRHDRRRPSCPSSTPRQARCAPRSSPTWTVSTCARSSRASGHGRFACCGPTRAPGTTSWARSSSPTMPSITPPRSTSTTARAQHESCRGVLHSAQASSLTGTHHHVSVEHLHRYLAEHDFRYSTCKMSDSARMARIMDQAEGRRLTYRRVTAA